MQNKGEWRYRLDRLKKRDIYVPPWADRAVEYGLNIRDKAVYLKNKERVIFNDIEYKRFKLLQDHFKYAKNPNYFGCTEFEEQCDKMVAEYEKLGIFREAETREIPLVQINPLNCLKVRENKFALLVHSLDNARYSQPEMSLMDLLQRGEALIKPDNFTTHDLKSCYMQFELSRESKLAMGVRYKNRVLICQTGMYGPSAMVIMVNTLVNLICLDASIKFDKWTEGFIDDIIVQGLDRQVRPYMEKLGFIFAEGKSKQGNSVDYIGYRIDSKNKTLETLPKTYEKLKNIQETKLFHNRKGECFIEYDILQKLCGIIIHASKTAPTGLTRSFYLLRKLAEGSMEPGKMVKFESSEIRELKFWCESRQILPMKMMKISGSTVKVLESDPSKRQRVEKLGNCTDASGSYYAAKVGNLTKTGKFPVKYQNEGIGIKEQFTVNVAVKMAEPNTKTIINTDSQNVYYSSNKKRSKNELMNELIEEMVQEMIKYNKIVEIRWVPTARMAEIDGADRLSRRNFDECYDPLTLSEAGVKMVTRTFGPITTDIFSSPKNNVFDVKYCSTYWVSDDRKNLMQDGLSFLASSNLHGRLWAFMPQDLTMPTLKMVSEIDWSKKMGKLQVLMLIRQKNMKDCVAYFWHKRKEIDLSWTIFYEENNKAKFLKMKTKTSYILVAVGKLYK